MNSGNHVMQIGDLGVWMYEYLAGIRTDPADPGFHHIEIRPYQPAGLSSVKASHQSMYGRIASAWKRENGVLTMEVTVPANTTATIWVPAASENDVTEGLGPASKARGIKFLRMDAGAAVFAAGSGSYVFRAK